MDVSRSFLAPLTNAARNLSAYAKEAGNRASDFDIDASRRKIADAAQQLADFANEEVHTARDIASQKAELFKRAANSAQKRLYEWRDSADAKAHELSKSLSGSARSHPVAATLVVVGASYLVYRAWRLFRTAAPAKTSTAKRVTARPNRAANGSAAAAKRKSAHVS